MRLYALALLLLATPAAGQVYCNPDGAGGMNCGQGGHCNPDGAGGLVCHGDTSPDYVDLYLQQRAREEQQRQAERERARQRRQLQEIERQLEAIRRALP